MRYRPPSNRWDEQFEIDYEQNLKDIERDISNAESGIQEAETNASKAKVDVEKALINVTTAVETAKSTKEQLDAVVSRATDSDAMSRQAAIDVSGVDKGNLKKRIDDDYNEITSKLILKRDTATKITGSDLDTSSDAMKIQQINLSEEVKQMMAGITPINAEVANGGVTSEKYANNSITSNKLAFRFMLGLIKQGTLNIDTVNSKIIFNGGGVFVDNLSKYIAYQAHEILLPSTTVIFSIYFNTVTKLFEGYVPGSVIPNEQNLAYICTYWQGLFNSVQDYGTLLVNGNKPAIQDVYYENIKMPLLYCYALNGDIKIDTTEKTITYNAFNMLTPSGRNKVIQAGSSNWKNLANGAINIYWNYTTNAFVFYHFGDSAQNTEKLFFFGSVYDNKLHASLSNKFVKVNNVPEGGWYVAPTDLNKNRITTLNEVWNNWEKGNKYPIAFLGDSTTDGNTTSYTTRNIVGMDYINQYAYPYLLEQLIKKETGNTNVRVYNAGFSGKTSQWAKDNIESIFGSGTPYADAKMVGISYGINDSVNDDIQSFYTTFKSNIEWLINYFRGKNIQPFLLTTQATLMKVGSKLQSQTHKINTVANQVKFELANKYNLEIFETNKFTEMFMMYSKHQISLIEPDVLHFGDIGHKYESHFYFANICPRVIKSTNVNQISLITQNGKVNLAENQMIKSSTSKYKYIVDFTRAETTDIEILDVLLFNDEQTQLKLSVVGDVVIKINEVEITDIDNYELELGLHHIKVISRQTHVYFEGISINRI
ncbi:SGNH/GDSL hydrolase family protein [Bacillus zanthoxyli]|nr:SGNH/GDSL hydrolase family protein [Bacillus zanthoxyli]